MNVDEFGMNMRKWWKERRRRNEGKKLGVGGTPLNIIDLQSNG